MKLAILALCSFTGNITKPWVEAGYHAILVDPQHIIDSQTDNTTKLACTVGEFITKHIGSIDAEYDVRFIASFPPCTDLAVSGARWFKRKREANPNFQEEAMGVVNECSIIAMHFRCPFFIENPVSVISSQWRKPDYTFHPYEYTKHRKEDNYTKKTCLWTGAGFRMPAKAQDTSLPTPDNRIHMAPPGDERANFRSATPQGFAEAVFQANKDKQERQLSFENL